MTTYAIFGATGHLGSFVLDALAARGVAPGDIRALGRNEAALADLAARGFQTARVDLNDPATIPPALVGVDKTLLISGSEVGQRVAQHTAAIEAAKAAGVSFLAYTSAPHADTTDLVLAPEHKATEEALAASGLAHAVLRNGWYTENYRDDFERAREGGVIANSVGQGRIASAERRDFAEAAAAVLTGDGHEGKVYELTGDAAWTFADFAATASAVLGKDIAYRTLLPEDELAALGGAGLPNEVADFVVSLNKNIRDGAVAEVNGVLSGLIGRPTASLEETLRSWA